MSNDLSTLNGALLEMKDQLIYELGQKGVTASYSSTDGLLGLIGKISEIQTGGGSCYNVVFGKASYITTGTATVSVTVLKNYAPCTNESVTFTSSTSTTTTATTNSSGVATATITFSGSTTLTASIGGATATATITVASYYFYDPVTSDNSSAYTQKIIFADTNPSPTLEASLTYNSNGYYVFDAVNNSDNFCGFEIPNTYGQDNIRLRAKVMLNSSSPYCQFGLGFQTVTYNTTRDRAFFRIRGDNNIGYLDGTSDSALTTRITQRNVVRILEIERTGGTVTINEYDGSNNLLYTTNYTLQNTYTPSSCYYFFGRNMRNTGNSQNIYEIKAEPI